jgi:hypothetical protein
MSLGTPRRMKMTFIAAPPQSSSRASLQRVRSEVVCYLAQTQHLNHQPQTVWNTLPINEL